MPLYNTTAVPRKVPILPYFRNCAAKEALRLCPRPGGPRGLEKEREESTQNAIALAMVPLWPWDPRPAWCLHGTSPERKI